MSEEIDHDIEVISDSGVARRHAGALRTARWRARRERGFKVFQIEVSEADIDQLIRRCLLDRQDRDDPAKIERAIGLWLDQLDR